MGAADKLKNITEIDLAQGLKTVAGNEMIYLRLLSKLDPLIEKSIISLSAEDIGTNMQVVSFEMHSVKGAMYNLGVMKIGDIARDIEQFAKDGLNAQVVDALPDFLSKLKDFKERLAIALKS